MKSLYPGLRLTIINWGFPFALKSFDARERLLILFPSDADLSIRHHPKGKSRRKNEEREDFSLDRLKTANTIWAQGDLYGQEKKQKTNSQKWTN